MMIVEAHDEMEDSHRMVSLRATFSVLKGATTAACGSMPLVDKVNLTEDYQSGTALLDSNRTICEDVEVR